MEFNIGDKVIYDGLFRERSNTTCIIIGENNIHTYRVKFEDGKEFVVYKTNVNPIPIEKRTLTESITYHINPPVTVCILPGKHKGIARCNPKDAWDEDKGKTLALVRALKQKVARG